MSTMTLPAVEERGIDLSTAHVDLREDAADGAKKFAGHASVFDTRYAIGNPLTWGFYEQVARGAFTKTISEGDQRFLVDHDSAKPVSRVSAGTLRLAEDKVGLAVDSDLNTAKSYVADLVENLADGTVTGMSIGFQVIKDSWATETVTTSDGQAAEIEVRTVLEARLIEVSAVTFPASESTDAGVRSSSDAELRKVAAALVHRGDVGAFERRAAYRSDLNDFRHLLPEPAEATRNDEEPADATPSVDAQARMRGLALRYGLPMTAPDTDTTPKEQP